MQQRLRQFIISTKPYVPTFRLAGSYLAIIMTMSIAFSAILFHTSSREIERQLPPDSMYSRLRTINQGVFDDFFTDRIERGKHELFVKLFIINTFVLIGGSAVSYVLARRTLEPIEDAMEAQSRFASDASHELRTPLAAIQTENEVALRNPNLTLARSKELLASNLEEVTRLQGLSEGLLKLARQTSHDMRLESVNLPDVVGTATNNFLKLAQAKKITIDDSVGNIVVFADELALTQALGVLLDNAIKYSPEKTTIRVSATTKNKQVCLTVSDEGAGIKKADLPYIFDRFYRADLSRTSQTVSGHGLGLALAQNIVKHMGGSISVKSAPNKGARFSITLPVA